MRMDRKTQSRAGLDDDTAMTTALTDFVLKTMETPLTERRVQNFLKRWRKARGESFSERLEFKLRALLAINDPAVRQTSRPSSRGLRVAH